MLTRQLPQVDEVTEPVKIVEMAYALPSDKGPGPYGVPDSLVTAIVLRKPEDLVSILNNCLSSGSFPRSWTSAN